MFEIDWKLVLEYLRLILGWPVVTGVLAFSAIRAFRQELSDAIGRVSEAEFGGQKIVLNVRNDNPLPTEDAIVEAVSDEQDRYRSKEKVGADFPIPVELANDPHAPAAIAWVRNNPAQTVVEYKRVLQMLNFERVFHRIYGSQISLLEYLATRESASVGRLLKFYKLFQEKAGVVTYSQSSYFDFLHNFSLVQSVDGQPGRKIITKQGRDFLDYIKQQYPDHWSQRYY